MLFSVKYANAYFDYLQKDLKHILTKLCVCVRARTCAQMCVKNDSLTNVSLFL